MGEGTSAAQARVVAAREGLDEELVRLEAAARAAVDIPAKARRNPVGTAGLAAGAGFLLVGGPARLFRRTKRAILGPSDPLPKSMLPKEIDESLKKLGTDGQRVRGIIEREFARYLDEKAPERRERDLGAVLALLLGSVAKPVTQRYARQMVERLMAPDGPGYRAHLDRARGRRPSDGPGA